MLDMYAQNSHTRSSAALCPPLSRELGNKIECSHLLINLTRICFVNSQIGCYQGFAFAWRYLLNGCAAERDSRKMKVLESLIGMIQKFPYDDPTYAALHEDLDRIRGKFKQLCSLLNVQPDFKISTEGSGLSF
uniref:LTO1 maturation factor of ABCE1 n=1 Tax=Molossus molossus TaxID=27622 RepID=A0A7J8ERJ1_MOLMO|nr:LTO1 maturation factor of ABCE1 [Molossus molossus]